MTERQFDVFLAHRSKDKPLIRQIHLQLKARGLKPWLDEEEIPPGTSFQDELQQAISQVKAAAICIGKGEFSPWQTVELNAFISQWIEREIPVIPVLLPGAKFIPENLLFLKQFHAVIFKGDIEEEQAFFQLEWGITGQRPKQVCNALESRVTLKSNDLDVRENNDILNRVAQRIEPKAQTSPPLLSDKGISYKKLQSLLKDKKWKAADYETALCMLTAVGRTKDDFLRSNDLHRFPCTDLKTIDRLWQEYSRERFGFSVQKDIYLSVGGRPDGEYPKEEVWQAFGKRVGWHNRKKWISYPETVKTSILAHLPIRCYMQGAVFSPYLASRITICNL